MRSIGVAEGPYLIMVISVTNTGLLVIDDPIENTIPKLRLNTEQTLKTCEFMNSSYDDLINSGEFTPEQITVNENSTPFSLMVVKLILKVKYGNVIHKVIFIKGHNHHFLCIDNNCYSVQGQLTYKNEVFFDHVLITHYSDTIPFTDY